MRLLGSRIVKCTKCGESRKVADWDSDSLAMAKSRAERRSFVSLSHESGRNKEKPKFYYCRTCGEWHKATDLEVE